VTMLCATMRPGDVGVMPMAVSPFQKQIPQD
jgi:hypothetical protein